MLNELKLTIKCIYGTKLGDSILIDEDGSIVPIHPDTFYEVNLSGYWNLKQVGMKWEILQVLVVPKGWKVERSRAPTQNHKTQNQNQNQNNFGINNQKHLSYLLNIKNLNV